MLNAKENFRETIRGGNPDRYVNQYEAITFVRYPYQAHSPRVEKGGPDVVNDWGVTLTYPSYTPGGYPVHTKELTVVKDIEDWKSYVKAPPLIFSQDEWDSYKQAYDAVDGEKAYRAAFVAPGLFEHMHRLASMEEALMAYITNPDEMHDMIRYVADWELELAEGICSHLHPDAIFHHDDFGTETSSFLDPEMFADFFLEPYREIYGYYHDNGVELIIHHADSYCANLVPTMIDMGIDVWQGCMHSNNVPALVEKYGEKMTFMGNIDNKFVDFDGWTEGDCARAAKDAIDACGMKYYVPCITQGLPGSVYPGAYEAITKAIDAINSEKFGWSAAELQAARL